MKNQIVKPEIAKAATFHQCSLISADFLNIKKVYKNKIINNETIEVDNSIVVIKNLSENPCGLSHHFMF